MDEYTKRTAPAPTEALKLVRHRMLLGEVGGSKLRFDVHGQRAGIGSAAGNEVRIEEASVSRHHAEIVVRDGRYLLRDLGSTNGTYVAEVQVREAFLEPGMHLRVGDVRLDFEPDARLETVAPAGERLGEMVAKSSVMRSIFGLLQEVAATPLSLLLTGETGTGKELAARAVHELSGRGAFRVIDCAALHGNLIESELFGHERGAFTGAHQKRAGAFEAAAGGTVFLDEVGELPVELQPRLLRVLERRELMRLGGNEVIDVDVRVLAATHRHLAEMVREGSFREDLYYRLAEVVIELPALRERPDDIATIATTILAADYPGRTLDASALTALKTRAFPGNVRELRNIVRRAAAVSKEPEIGQAAISRALSLGRPIALRSDPEEAELGLALPLREARRLWVADHTERYLGKLVERFGGDLDAVAEHAQVHRKSIQRLQRKGES